LTSKTDSFTKKPEIKPNTKDAMEHLLDQIAQHFPLNKLDVSICQKICVGCPKKLLQYMEQEYDFWREVLAKSETPTLGDIHKLAKSSIKIHKALSNNGILKP